MLKRITLIFFIFPTILYSQSFSPQVISSVGNQGSTTNYQISYTIGQLNTYSGGNQSIILTQGFQQSFAFSPSVEQPVICLVTLDTFTQKNMVVWERQGGFRTAFYNIYRESTTAGVYIKIGSRLFDSISSFVDNNSNPRKQAYRYRISAVDSLGNESSFSPVHKTIHLTANKGTSNENHLIWTGYEGKSFGTYYIYRGKKINNLILIDSIQSSLTQYSDFTANSGIQYYMVSAKFLGECYPSKVRAHTNSGPYSQSASNLKEYSAIQSDYLAVAPPIQSINGSPDTTIFEVFTNLDSFEATSDKSWLTIAIDTATNRIFVYAVNNPTANMRTASIKVTGLNVSDQYVTVMQNGFTSMNNNSTLLELLIYPNPYKGLTNITFSIANKTWLDLSIYSMSGKRIKNFYTGEVKPGKYSYQFSAVENGYPSGLYMLKLQNGSKQIIRKLIELK
jgi:hypothetical protein